MSVWMNSEHRHKIHAIFQRCIEKARRKITEISEAVYFLNKILKNKSLLRATASPFHYTWNSAVEDSAHSGKIIFHHFSYCKAAAGNDSPLLIF